MSEQKARPVVERRQFVKALGAIAAGATGVSEAVPAGRLTLDLDKPRDNLVAWMKIRASLETRDVYFWFTGTLEIAVPGEPVRPIVALESLILRRSERLGEYLFHVTDWEATIYRHVVDGAPVTGEIENPITQRKVRPLNYREGPVPFEYTDTRRPRVIGPDNPLTDSDKPFGYPWRIVSGDIWMTKPLYISGRPQWLDIRQFPEETPATPLNVQTSSVLKARLADVLDPGQSCVRADFFYEAASDWLPWMLLGARPGFLIWHEAGKKLFSLDEAPAETLKIMEQVHPKWFGRPVPWEGFTNIYLMYRDQRQAAGK